MIKGLFLVACASVPEKRPEPLLKSEHLLREGLIAFQNDELSDAQQKFTAALLLYQSIDNTQGIILSRLNLFEAALALSDFTTATNQLLSLEYSTKQGFVTLALQKKIILLASKLSFEQQHYKIALRILQPLWSAIEERLPMNELEWEVLVLHARLEMLIAPRDFSKGLANLETAVSQQTIPSPYSALLKRLLAMRAIQGGEFQTAAALLKEALIYYQAQAQRRSIAACLEEMAELEVKQQHIPAARDVLQRALVIRQWLKNDFKTVKIQERLKQLERLH
jgi:tetratricopeptide (TPR) repeat protein